MEEKSAKEILGLKFSPVIFITSGENLLDDKTVKQNHERLKASVEKMEKWLSDASKADINQILVAVHNAFISDVKPEKVPIDSKGVRILSYNIKPERYRYISYELDILDTHWNSHCFRGLLHSILKNWTEYDYDSRQLLTLYFSKKIKGSDSKTAKQLFEAADTIPYHGAGYRLGQDLIKEHKPVTDCCQRFMLPRNRINYSYFSDVIVGYYDSATAPDIKELRAILTEHNNSSADKRVIPSLIIRYDESHSLLPDAIMKLAIERIGDPSIESNWASLPGFDRKSTDNLAKARQILIRAISAQIINLFFSNLCSDLARRNFWMNYTERIQDFRVYGSETSKGLMKGIVSPIILERHFYAIQSNASTCALVMDVGTHVIIEFSDVGAMYVYWKSGQLYKSIFEDRFHKINTMNDLKIPDIGKLVSNEYGTTYFWKEGKMNHQGGWDIRMRNWIRRVL